MTIHARSFNAGRLLTITSEVVDGALQVRFDGTADMSSIEALDEYLSGVHSRVLAERMAIVFVDFRQLEFMNSSCFKSFVTWLGNAQDVPVVQRYRIVVKSNREMHWQRRSLNALRSFAHDILSIES